MTRQTKAATEVRSIIERVLDLKKQQDDLGEDIREVYLEARKRGWNKTSIGQAVGIIRKRDKDAATFDDVANDTAQYLQAYYGTGTLIAPHAHEALPPHDAETGEVIETEVQRGQGDKTTAPARKSPRPLSRGRLQAPPGRCRAELASPPPHPLTAARLTTISKSRRTCGGCPSVRPSADTDALRPCSPASGSGA